MHPILIAECCQNHSGDREILKRMIHRAAESGADYVKIQTLRSTDIAYRERFENGVVDPDGTVRAIKRPYKLEVERLSKLDLSVADEAWFVEECWRAGVSPLTTVFTRAAAREVADLGYEAVKVASYDCKSFPLLRDLKARWSKLFVSTGATTDAEIAQAAAILAGTDYMFLHCVTIYPTPMDQLHLRRMNWLRRFTPRVGFSDHTKPERDALWATKLALALGADCIERHYTIQDIGQTKDGPVSINPEQLKELRVFADRPRIDRMAIMRKEMPEWEKCLGQATRPLSHEEMLNRDYYSGRVASKINGRDVFNWEDIELDA